MPPKGPTSVASTPASQKTAQGPAATTNPGVRPQPLSTPAAATKTGAAALPTRTPQTQPTAPLRSTEIPAPKTSGATNPLKQPAPNPSTTKPPEQQAPSKPTPQPSAGAPSQKPGRTPPPVLAKPTPATSGFLQSVSATYGASVAGPKDTPKAGTNEAPSKPVTVTPEYSKAIQTKTAGLGGGISASPQGKVQPPSKPITKETKPAPVTSPSKPVFLKTPNDLSQPKYATKTQAEWPSCLNALEDSYLVVMKTDQEGSNPKQREAHVSDIQKLCNATLGDRYGIQVGPKDLSNIFPAYMGFFPKDMVKTIGNSPAVKYVEQNKRLQAAERCADWTHSRATLPFAQFKELRDRSKLVPPGFPKFDRWEAEYPSRGKGVHIYILDADGFDDADFKLDPDRLELEWNSISTGQTGHGTMVANVAAGDTLGLANEATVHAFCKGKLETLYLIFALGRIGEDHEFNKRTFSILNCSWTSNFGSAPEQSIIKALKTVCKMDGMVVNLAAGNYGKDWEGQYAATHIELSKANLVGGVDMSGTPDNMTNYGKEITIFGPGTDVKAGLGPGGIVSGTSFAAPFVTGYIACVYGSNGLRQTFELEKGAIQVTRMLDSLAVVMYQYMNDSGELLPLKILGPPSMCNDLVVWPIMNMKAAKTTSSAYADGRERDTNVWDVYAPSSSWNIRSRTMIGWNVTKCVTNNEMTAFVDCLKLGSVEEIKKYWTTSLGFDWDAALTHEKVWTNADVLVFTEPLADRWKVMGKFLERQMQASNELRKAVMSFPQKQPSQRATSPPPQKSSFPTTRQRLLSADL